MLEAVGLSEGGYDLRAIGAMLSARLHNILYSGICYIIRRYWITVRTSASCAQGGGEQANRWGISFVFVKLRRYFSTRYACEVLVTVAGQLAALVQALPMTPATRAR